MKEKIDLIIINVSFILELFIVISLRYSQYLCYISVYFKSEKTIYNKEAYLNFKFIYFFMFLFYILSFIYIMAISYKYKSRIRINFKLNTMFLISFLICDFCLYLFNIKAMIYESNAFRFIIICLLTNLVVYTKYKKNNIKIE